MPSLLRHTLRSLVHRLRVRGDDWRERTLWVLDLETGGLDPRTDPILAVGMVPIRDGVVQLGDAYHSLVHSSGSVRESSLMVHHILPRDLAEAPGPETVVPDVWDRLADTGVLIVHQRRMDIPFLHRAFEELEIGIPPFAVIDTVELLLRYARRHGHLTPERTAFPTALDQARDHFGLPPHRAHEALSDAVATAELFLVLAHRLGATRLKHLL